MLLRAKLSLCYCWWKMSCYWQGEAYLLKSLPRCVTACFHVHPIINYIQSCAIFIFLRPSFIGIFLVVVRRYIAALNNTIYCSQHVNIVTLVAEVIFPAGVRFCNKLRQGQWVTSPPWKVQSLDRSGSTLTRMIVHCPRAGIWCPRQNVAQITPNSLLLLSFPKLRVGAHKYIDLKWLF